MKSVILLYCFLLFFVLSISRPVGPQDIDVIPTDITLLDNLGQRIVFDYIVVGAGAAGNIVAARLANETGLQVALLEGGAQGTGQTAIGGDDFVQSHFVTNPKTGTQKRGIPLTRYDLPVMSDTVRQAADVLGTAWNITPVGFFYAQAKAVGGNQVANGAGWLIPQKADLDAWKIPGYYASEFFHYITDLENATDTGFTVGRGKSGPINVEFASFIPHEQSMFVAAAVATGYPSGGDMATGTITPGVYYQQYTTKEGIRQSTSVEFLGAVINKKGVNLDFRKSAVVTRVLFDIFDNAIGVEYSDVNGVLRKIYALEEVVITAGALQSAKILYNSGIGPSSILNAFDKPHRVVNEIVGQKVRNQQRAIITYNDPTFLLPNFYTLPAETVQFARNGTGLLNKQVAVLISQISPTAPYPELFITIFANGRTATDPYGNQLQVWVYLNQQIYANGTLNLTTSDPLGGTIYTSNALVVEQDAEMIARGFLKARAVMDHWNGSITEVSPGANVTSIPDLVKFIQANPFTSCHLYSSVPMGNDASFPLNPCQQVRGVNRLRVVGPAAVPGSVFVGMQALAMAMGEKGTDLILQTLRAAPNNKQCPYV